MMIPDMTSRALARSVSEHCDQKGLSPSSLAELGSCDVEVIDRLQKEDFGSVEESGKFVEHLESSGWMQETYENMATTYPNLKMISTFLFANCI